MCLCVSMQCKCCVATSCVLSMLVSWPDLCLSLCAVTAMCNKCPLATVDELQVWSLFLCNTDKSITDKQVIAALTCCTTVMLVSLVKLCPRMV